MKFLVMQEGAQFVCGAKGQAMWRDAHAALSALPAYQKFRATRASHLPPWEIEKEFILRDLISKNSLCSERLRAAKGYRESDFAGCGADCVCFFAWLREQRLANKTAALGSVP